MNITLFSNLYRMEGCHQGWQVQNYSGEDPSLHRKRYEGRGEGVEDEAAGRGLCRGLPYGAVLCEDNGEDGVAHV